MNIDLIVFFERMDLIVFKNRVLLTSDFDAFFKHFKLSNYALKKVKYFDFQYIEHM